MQEQEYIKLIGASGLILDIIGAVLIFFNSPQISHEVYIYNQEETDRLEKKARRNHLMTKIGLVLLIIGFVLQLLALLR